MSDIVIGDGSAVLREALREALGADALLAPLLGPVRFRIPEASGFPVTRLTIETTGWASATFTGGEHAILLDHWRTLALEDWPPVATDRLIALLELDALALTDHRIASRRFERLARLIEPEAGLRRLRFEARIRTYPL